MMAIDGKPVLISMVERFRSSGWGEVVVVVSDISLIPFVDNCSERLGEILHYVQNDKPEEGMISSIRLGLDWVTENVGGVLVWQVDHPLIGADVLYGLRKSASRNEVIIPTYKGRRGHPTWWGRGTFHLLRSQQADHGARNILRLPSVIVNELEVDDEAVLHNIDTPEDAIQYGLTRFEFGQ